MDDEESLSSSDDYTSSSEESDNPSSESSYLSSTEESSSSSFEDSDSESDSESESEEEENSDLSPPSNTQTISKREEDGTDRISDLPDAILQHILSFLDAKLVVQTCLVSTRWRYLWKSVPKLNFSLRKWVIRDEFMSFVDKVMFALDAPNLKKFSLSCDKICYSDRIEQWITAAVIRGVEEVNLHFDAEEDTVLPDIIFVSSRICAFTLKSNSESVRLPASMCLASQLKTLRLKCVTLPRADLRGKLVLSCPVLEYLFLRDCDHEHIQAFNISAPRLKYLVISNQSYNAVPNHCKIIVSTPNLISLKLKGSLYKDYCIKNLSSLVHAKIDSPEEEVPAQSLTNIVKGLCNATTVELSCHSVTKLQKSQDTSVLNNEYSNLTSLKLVGWATGPCIPALLNLLKNSHYIETLVLGMNQVKKAEDWGELFKCLNRLKSVDIQGIRGCEIELNFLGFLLKNAVVLEEFTAVTDTLSPKREKKMVEFSKKIHNLPRASSAVRILFLIRT